MAKEANESKAHARLPRWARQRIEKLEADLAHANWKLTRVGAEDSRVGWGMITDGPNAGQPFCGIPESEHVVFKLPDRLSPNALPRVIEVKLLGDNGIVVRANDGVLVVTPWLSNVVRISQRDHW